MTNSLETAMQKLRNGEIIALPTETVYGLAVDAGNKAAIEALYILKSRPQEKRLQLMVPDLQAAEKYVYIDDRARKLAAAFLPGPLTLVLPTRSGPETSLAIRIPNHPLTLELLKAYGKPLAATSANPSGEPAATSAEQVKSFYPQLHIIDGGPCALGIASTLFDLTGPEPKILREGSITKQQLDARL